MFTTKYRPAELSEFVGNKIAVGTVCGWLDTYNSNHAIHKNPTCALISGNCGIGKTLLAELALYAHNYTWVHMSSTDEHVKTHLDDLINISKSVLATNTNNTNTPRNAIIIENIDSSSEHGFLAKLSGFIKRIRIPVICICDNRYASSIKTIVSQCVDIKMSPPTYDEVYRLMYKIVTSEKIKITKSHLDRIYAETNGDIRMALNMLQVYSTKLYNTLQTHKDNKSCNIFETTGRLLMMDETLDDKLEVYWTNPDTHSMLIQENYISNTLLAREDIKKLENLAHSAQALSDANTIDSAIHCTNWDLLPYVAINIINATTKCNKKGVIKFPQHFGKKEATMPIDQITTRVPETTTNAVKKPRKKKLIAQHKC